MKRVKAVSRLGDAFLAHHAPSRSSRQLSTAVHRTASSPSPRGLSSHVRQSQLPSTPSNNARYSSYVPKVPEVAPVASQPLQKTPLYDLHVAHGGKMVPFGGFHMPVQYSSLSVSASHHFTRSHASLFDVSHMVQHRFSGPGATAFLERITPSSISKLKTHTSGLSTLLWPITGGIVDDTMITRLGPELFYVVTNAGCREKDLEYFKEELAAFKKEGGDKVVWDVLDGWGLIALQGPLSENILKSILAEDVDLKKLLFGQSKFLKVKLLGGETSSPLLVSRGGYTGEDGFEISIPGDETVAVTETLLQTATPNQLQLAGLGARDSLRLEAGMCLYGHDLDDDITPVEASLRWIIGKDRREAGGFHGDKVIFEQMKARVDQGVQGSSGGVERKRVGLIIEGAPAREGAEVVDEKGTYIGRITSGCPSPSLGKNIAMGYLKTGYHKTGTNVEVVVRGKKRKAQVVLMPFVPSKYWKGEVKA